MLLAPKVACRESLFHFIGYPIAHFVSQSWPWNILSGINNVSMREPNFWWLPVSAPRPEHSCVWLLAFQFVLVLLDELQMSYMT